MWERQSDSSSGSRTVPAGAAEPTQEMPLPHLIPESCSRRRAARDWHFHRWSGFPFSRAASASQGFVPLALTGFDIFCYTVVVKASCTGANSHGDPKVVKSLP